MDKLELKSCHKVIDTVSVADVESIFYGKPIDPDFLTVVMKNGKMLYCDEVCPIDSLQEEPVSEELEAAAKKSGQKYFPDEYNIWTRQNYEAKNAEYSFIDGANWQKQQTIDKAAEWLSELDDALFLGYDNDGYPYIDRDGLARDFKKYMKD